MVGCGVLFGVFFTTLVVGCGAAPVASEPQITAVQVEAIPVSHELPQPYHKTNAVLQFVQSLASDCKNSNNFKLEMRAAKQLMDLEMNTRPVAFGKSDKFFDEQVKAQALVQTEAETTTQAKAQPGIPKSWEDKSTPPNDLPVLRVSLPGSQKKQPAFIMFGEHGRELISCEIGMSFLQSLHDAVCSDSSSGVLANSLVDIAHTTTTTADNNAVLSSDMMNKGLPETPVLLEISESDYSSSTPYTPAQVHNLLSSWDLTILPIVSPSAREIAEQHDFCNRKNSHNVDVNRNYPFHFGEGNHDQNSEQYPGNAPLTEPETRLAAEIAQEIKPKLFLSVHSGAEMIVTSPAYRKVKLSQLPDGVQKVVKGIQSSDCPQCSVGPASQVLSYLAYGCSMDYMFEQGFNDNVDATKPSQEHFAFTFETWSGDREVGNVQNIDLERTFGTDADRIRKQTQTFNGLKQKVGDEQFTCLTRFNPPPSMYPQTVSKWTKALFSTMDAVGKELATKQQ